MTTKLANQNYLQTAWQLVPSAESTFLGLGMISSSLILTIGINGVAQMLGIPSEAVVTTTALAAFGLFAKHKFNETLENIEAKRLEFNGH